MCRELILFFVLLPGDADARNASAGGHGLGAWGRSGAAAVGHPAARACRQAPAPPRCWRRIVNVKRRPGSQDGKLRYWQTHPLYEHVEHSGSVVAYRLLHLAGCVVKAKRS